MMTPLLLIFVVVVLVLGLVLVRLIELKSSSFLLSVRWNWRAAAHTHTSSPSHGMCARACRYSAFDARLLLAHDLLLPDVLFVARGGFWLPRANMLFAALPPCLRRGGSFRRQECSCSSLQRAGGLEWHVVQFFARGARPIILPYISPGSTTSGQCEPGTAAAARRGPVGPRHLHVYATQPGWQCRETQRFSPLIIGFHHRKRGRSSRFDVFNPLDAQLMMSPRHGTHRTAQCSSVR